MFEKEVMQVEKESYNIDDILSEVKKHKEKELREAENAFKLSLIHI